MTDLKMKCDVCGEPAEYYKQTVDKLDLSRGGLKTVPIDRVSVHAFCRTHYQEDKQQPTLDDLITELARYGEPHLGMYGGVWICDVSVTIASGRTHVDAKSRWFKTPHEAASHCLEQCRQVMAELEAKAV